MVTNVMFRIKGRCSLVCSFVWKRDPSRNEFRPAVVRTIVFNALSVQGSSRRYRKCFCGCPERKNRRGATRALGETRRRVERETRSAAATLESAQPRRRREERSPLLSSHQFFRYQMPEKLQSGRRVNFTARSEPLEFGNFTFSILRDESFLACSFFGRRSSRDLSPPKLGRPNTNFVTVLP